MINVLKKIRIIYECKNYLCLHKPSGLIVHATKYMKNFNRLTLVDWLKEKFPEVINVGDDKEYRPGIIHRLDKDTSGIMLIALNQKTFIYFKKLFANREIKKVYKAIVLGEIKDDRGIIDIPIGIKSGTIKRTTFSNKMLKEAVTEFEKIGIFEKEGNKFTYLNIYPKTGRTHQIRVHLNTIHHPIVGDQIYGGKRNKNLSDRIMLHAFSIDFLDIDKSHRYFKDKLPKDFSIFLPRYFV